MRYYTSCICTAHMLIIEWNFHAECFHYSTYTPSVISTTYRLCTATQYRCPSCQCTTSSCKLVSSQRLKPTYDNTHVLSTVRLLWWHIWCADPWPGVLCCCPCSFCFVIPSFSSVKVQQTELQSVQCLKLMPTDRHSYQFELTPVPRLLFQQCKQLIENLILLLWWRIVLDHLLLRLQLGWKVGECLCQ